MSGESWGRSITPNEPEWVGAVIDSEIDRRDKEIKQLRERAVYDHDCLTVIESERNEAVADLAEAETLLLYANCSREWYDKRDTFLARRNKT